MRFDLSGCGAGLDESASSLLQLGPWAEALGYDGLWLNEEHFGQNSRVCLSPILLATALAMRTRTIRIGFSVLVLPLYQPIRLAEQMATLDILSEGRVDLGVSRGNTSRYFEAWGLDYENRSPAFDEALGTLIRYWTDAKVQVGSRTESIEPKCVQKPHPPIYVATYREDAAAWLGEHGLTLFQGSQQSVESMRRCILAFKDAGGDVAQVPVGRFVGTPATAVIEVVLERNLDQIGDRIVSCCANSLLLSALAATISISRHAIAVIGNATNGEKRGAGIMVGAPFPCSECQA